MSRLQRNLGYLVSRLPSNQVMGCCFVCLGFFFFFFFCLLSLLLLVGVVVVVMVVVFVVVVLRGVSRVLRNRVLFVCHVTCKSSVRLSAV